MGQDFGSHAMRWLRAGPNLQWILQFISCYLMWGFLALQDQAMSRDNLFWIVSMYKTVVKHMITVQQDSIRLSLVWGRIKTSRDGITDLEAVESTQGADLFIGYGGVVERKAVAAAAPWFVYSHDTLAEALGRRKEMLAEGLGGARKCYALGLMVLKNDCMAKRGCNAYRG
eukprot:1137762-Pelagomonas_calceolata.AAC.10